ncbi:MAG: protein kinase [Planctomycetes bacterium]|nr:protein kinase [Planctomycetota bacterium]
MSGPVTFPKVGDFELLAKLGEGGMGAVYQARQLSLQRIVALKILAPKYARDQEYVQRFQLEARATGKLNHPHIVAATAVGYADGYYYFAMEYIEGESLKAKLVRQGALSEAETVRIGAAVADALAHAHAEGIIHRDVKPDNILIDRLGTPKLTDLGLAKLQEKEDGSLTKSGSTVGTPHYISPEQACGEKDIDGRADMYSLGCTLYHAATGHTPFDAANAAMLMVKHINEKMPHPQAHRPELTEAFCSVIGHMVARQREDRYADMREAADDLAALSRGDMPRQGTLPVSRSNFIGVSRVPKLATSKKLVIPERGHSSRTLPVVTRHGERRAQGPRKPADAPGAAFVAAGAFALLTIAGLGWLLLGAKNTTPELRPAAKAENAKSSDAGASLDPAKHRSGAASAEADPTGSTAAWETIFNGTDLTGWKNESPEWRVENGELVGESKNKDNAVLGYNQIIPADFELRFVVTRPGSFHVDWAYNQIPIDLLARQPDGSYALARYFGENIPNRDLATCACKPAGKPEDVRVVVRGAAIEVYLDGVSKISYGAGQFIPGKPRVLNFFVHAGQTAAFKDIRIRDLTTTSVAKAPPPVEAPMDDFTKEISALSPDEQIVRVMDKLKALNPGFDGKCENQAFAGKVTELKFDIAQVRDISPLRAFRGLTKLQMATEPPKRSPLADLSSLRGLPISYLQCDFANVTDLTPLQGMKLAALIMDCNPIADLCPIKGLPLTVLQVSWSKVRDLAPLKGMRLSRLRLDGCPVSDLAPLQSMPLISLMIGGTAVTDITPLQGMPLKELRLELRKEYAPVLKTLGSLQSLNDHSAASQLEDAGPANLEGYTSLIDNELTKWTVLDPSWSAKDGVLTGRGTEKVGNAVMRIANRLPPAFDLRFTAECEVRFHFVLDLHDLQLMVQRDPDGAVQFYGIQGGDGTSKKSLGRIAGKAGTAAQEFRVLCLGKKVQVSLDGRAGIELNNVSASEPASVNLTLYVSKSGSTVFRRFCYKKLAVEP